MVSRLIKRFFIVLFLILLCCSAFRDILAKDYPECNSIPIYKIVFIKDILPQVNINDAYAALKVWVNELSKISKNKFEAEPEIVNNIEDIKNIPDRGNILLINMKIQDYFEYKDKLKLEGAYLPTNNGSVYNTYILLSRCDSRNIGSLKGKKLGLQSTPIAEIQNEWLDVVLNKNKYKIKEKFFRGIKQYENSSQLILGVFFGKIDACVASRYTFDLMCELNPQIAKKLCILADSPGLINSISCFTGDFTNMEHKNFAIEYAQKLSSFPGGKQIMTLTNTQQITPFKEEYLENTFKVIAKYKNIRGKAGK
jgi:phosphonate transport system substrate-binding protein